MDQKILVVAPELEYTGASQCILQVCVILRKNGYFADLWSCADGPYRAEFDKIGIHVKIVPDDSVDEAFLHQELTQYNLVIANTIGTYKIADLAQYVVPVVWYIHEAEYVLNLVWKTDQLAAIRRAEKLYAVSEYARDHIVEYYNSNVEVIHNFADDVFAGEGSYLSVNPQDKIKFLALGTIEKNKGFDILVDSFIALPASVRDNCELHFAGRLCEAFRDFYSDILEKIKPYDNIFYHGELRERERVYELINACHVVVVPSRDESCSLTALEGAMMARPLILSQNIGAQYILDENCGWFAATGDAQALSQAYINAVNKASDLSSMGKSARENYLKTSTCEIYEKNIVKMVEDNIAGAQPLYRLQDDLALYSFYWQKVNRAVQRYQAAEQEIDRAAQKHQAALQAAEQEINQAVQRYEAVEAELRGVYLSKSYKIGRLITWLPRKLRGGIRCLQEHGFDYTLRRVLSHLHLIRAER